MYSIKYLNKKKKVSKKIYGEHTLSLFLLSFFFFFSLGSAILGLISTTSFWLGGGLILGGGCLRGSLAGRRTGLGGLTGGRLARDLGGLGLVGPRGLLRDRGTE